MKKKILASIMSMVTSVVLIGGATFAVFSDTASNSGNIVKAGYIELEQERDTGDTVPGPMFYSAVADPSGLFPYDAVKNPYPPPGQEAIGGWAPGDKVIRAMNLFNKGTLYAKVTKLKADVNVGGESSGKAYNEFINKMKIKVTYVGQNRVIYQGPLSGLLNGWVNISQPIIAAPKSGAMNIQFEAYFDITAGDNVPEVQGKNYIFDFSFYAEQLKNNI